MEQSLIKLIYFCNKVSKLTQFCFLLKHLNHWTTYKYPPNAPQDVGQLDPPSPLPGIDHPGSAHPQAGGQWGAHWGGQVT